jgi:hypothetical protein
LEETVSDVSIKESVIKVCWLGSADSARIFFDAMAVEVSAL